MMHRYVLSLTFLHPIFVNVAGILSVCCEIQDTRQRTLVGTPDRIGKVLPPAEMGLKGRNSGGRSGCRFCKGMDILDFVEIVILRYNH